MEAYKSIKSMMLPDAFVGMIRIKFYIKGRSC